MEARFNNNPALIDDGAGIAMKSEIEFDDNLSDEESDICGSESEPSVDNMDDFMLEDL